jgi:probable rRNA maturation factor
MKIDFVKSYKGSCDITKQKAETIAESILAKLQYNQGNVTIEVFLVEKDKIKKINDEFRKINQATDVLSFPQETLNNIPEKNIGSIIISPEVAEKTKQKCSDLFIHGLLHLLGYDHEADKLNWAKAEEKIAKK